MTAPVASAGGADRGPHAGAILNWREIDAVLAELDLAGCFIRDVRQPVHHRLVLELYAPRHGRFWLLAELGGPFIRLHRLQQRPRELGDAQRFVTFMRAHVRSARIRAASQVAEERIIKLEVEHRDRELLIWIRLWTNAANCIVTETDGGILDALYRRPGRGEISGGNYHPERDLVALQARRAAHGAAHGARHRDAAARTFGDSDLPFNLRVERHFAALEADADARRDARFAAAARTADERRAERLVARLRRECEAASGHERLLQLGNLLLANLARVEPGARRVVVDDYHTGGSTTIDLASDKSPAENAQSYFERAKQARRRLHNAGTRLAQAERELAALRAVDPATTPPPSGAGASEAAHPGDASARPRGAPKPAAAGARAGAAPAGVRQFASGGFTLLVGRSAAQNDAALRTARGNDWWFHCRDFPGAHVFVRHRGAVSVPLDTMLDAGNLAVFFSKARSAAQADVYYTQVKYLRRLAARGRGAAAVAGRVIPTRERNLFIKLDPTRLERLLPGSG